MAERLSPEGLRYARAVAESGSFSAAARAQGVTQPALSNVIARLEEQLGERLFDRSARGVTPTAFGLAVLPLIEKALAAIDAVSAEAGRWNPPATDSIRMGVSPLISPHLVARAYASVREMAAARGPCQLVLREANMVELREALAVGELDIIVVPSVGPMPRYEHRVIDSEPLILIDSHTGSTSPAELAELADAQLILLPDTCGLTTFTHDLLASRGLTARPYPGEASSYRVLEEWSALGLGTAVLPESKLTAPVGSRRTVHDDGQPVEIFYEAVWDPGSLLARELNLLADGLMHSGR